MNGPTNRAIGTVSVWEWRTFSNATWDATVALASKLDELSANASNTRLWNKDHNLIGKLGEEYYGALTQQPVNRSVSISDGGTDFPGIDVKASVYWNDPYLKAGGDVTLKAPIYALVALDMEKRRARLCGYATREMVKAAPTQSFGRGKPCHVLYESQLVTADVLLPLVYAANGRQLRRVS
jgi:hypothetical protein